MTTITYTEPDWASVTTDDPRLIDDLRAYSDSHPDECVILTSGAENITRAKCPPGWIHITAPIRHVGKASADDYLAARTFLERLGKAKRLSPQQRSTLRGQALHGDVEGAWRGLERLMKG